MPVAPQQARPAGWLTQAYVLGPHAQLGIGGGGGRRGSQLLLAGQSVRYLFLALSTHVATGRQDRSSGLHTYFCEVAFAELRWARGLQGLLWIGAAGWVAARAERRGH